MVSKVGLFTSQARSAKFVLVKIFTGFKVLPFLSLAPESEGRAMDVSCASPDTAKASTRRPDVVIHLPTRPEMIAFVRPADGLDDFALDHVAKVREAVERFKGARLVSKTALCLACDSRNVKH